MIRPRDSTTLTPDPKISTPRIAKKAEEGVLVAGLQGELETFWLEEAQRRHIRLPSYKTLPTTRKMELWLKRLGMTVPRYYELSGTKRLRDFMEMNPGWPLVSWVGIILEFQAREGEVKI